jgi:Bacterial Ig-like domain (group 3)
VTFEDNGAPIQGCANLAVNPSGASATVACSLSLPRLPRVSPPCSRRSPVRSWQGSISSSESITVGPDSTSTVLDASPTVDVGAATTFTATVTPPAGRPGPLEPTGSVEFLDGGQPIPLCARQPLTNSAATYTVSYAAAGQHSIAARYLGDTKFNGSSSRTENVNAASVRAGVLGTITSTME